MSMTTVQQLDACVRGLREAGCYRAGGYWLTPDGAVLAMDPAEAFRLLKRERLRSAVESELLRSGGRFTREYFPNASR